MITIEIFRNEADTLTFPAGTAIFNEGDTGHTMYVVVEGEVDLLVKGKLVESLGPGGVLGEMALLDNVPRSAGAIAKTACKLVEINEKRFKFLVQQTPNFALQLMRVVADRLRRMDNRL
jgi:CRP-like cAMP-binding protein